MRRKIVKRIVIVCMLAMLGSMLSACEHEEAVAPASTQAQETNGGEGNEKASTQEFNGGEQARTPEGEEAADQKQGNETAGEGSGDAISGDGTDGGASSADDGGEGDEQNQEQNTDGGEGDVQNQEQNADGGEGDGQNQEQNADGGEGDGQNQEQNANGDQDGGTLKKNIGGNVSKSGQNPGNEETNAEGKVSEEADTSHRSFLWKVAVGAIIVIVLILAILAVRYFRMQREDDAEDDVRPLDGSMDRKEPEPRKPAEKSQAAPTQTPKQEGGGIGKVHNVGKRSNQQDSLGVALTRWGTLAVVSDGMGGLSDGEKVSQKAVAEMINAAGRVTPLPSENPLYEMLAHANEQVLQMLGPEQIYKSGATLLAVLANNGGFHWIAVGDSRIYFYCGGHLLQLNSEHIYKKELILGAVNKNISFSRVASDVQSSRLVSFLGMGDLKYVEGSFHPVRVRRQDKVLLMSDGVFNTLREEAILKILESTGNAAEAAALLEKQVLAAGNPKQDNFSCIILDF